MEIWKNIQTEGFQHYLISNKGNLKNSKNNKCKKLQTDADGYKTVTLYNGKKKEVL